MGWKCDDCEDRDPKFDVIRRANCGRENVIATHADGLSEAVHREREAMLIHDFADMG